KPFYERRGPPPRGGRPRSSTKGTGAGFRPPAGRTGFIGTFLCPRLPPLRVIGPSSNRRLGPRAGPKCCQSRQQIALPRRAPALASGRAGYGREQAFLRLANRL